MMHPAFSQECNVKASYAQGGRHLCAKEPILGKHYSMQNLVGMGDSQTLLNILETAGPYHAKNEAVMGKCTTILWRLLMSLLKCQSLSIYKHEALQKQLVAMTRLSRSDFTLRNPNRLAELSKLAQTRSPVDHTDSQALKAVAAVLLGLIAIMLSLGLTTGMRSLGRAVFCRRTKNVSTPTNFSSPRLCSHLPALAAAGMHGHLDDLCDIPGEHFSRGFLADSASHSQHTASKGRSIMKEVTCMLAAARTMTGRPVRLRWFLPAEVPIEALVGFAP